MNAPDVIGEVDRNNMTDRDFVEKWATYYGIPQTWEQMVASANRNLARHLIKEPNGKN